MQYFKLNQAQLTQIDTLNDSWVEKYRLNYPDDEITQKYCEAVLIQGNWYILKDDTTTEYITDFMGIVEALPTPLITEWHEAAKYQIFLTHSQASLLAEQVPEMAVYRKKKNIISYRDETGVYFYVNYFAVGHRDLIEQYSTITERTEQFTNPAPQ